MAPLAASAPNKLLTLLRPVPGRLEFTLRLALICALTTFVVEFYGTPSAALTVYIVFFLNRPDRATSVILNIAMTLVISIIVGLVLLLAIAVLDPPGWRVATMALLSFTFMFLASASKLRPIANVIALIIGYALDLLGSVPFGEAATRGLLYAWLFIGIPAAISLVVNLLIAPAPRRLAESALGRRLRAAAAVLRQPEGAAEPAFQSYLHEGTNEVLGRVRLAGLEHTSPGADVAALARATRSTATLLFLTDALSHNITVPLDWREAASGTLGEMASVFEAGGYPVAIRLDAPGGNTPLSPSAGELIATFTDALAHFTDGSSPAPAPKEHAGFFLPDAFTNPAHAHHAIKTTVAAMTCYLLYSLLDWPGIHTALITCYIVSLSTAAETVEKLTLRIAGCLFGAVAGIAVIVWVIPSLQSVWDLMALVFAGAAVAGWVAAGSPRISYAGFQIAFAFFLCVIQGAAPGFDLVVARDRVIGILLGNLVSYLVFTRLWPVGIGQRIDPGIAALLKRLAAIARAPTLTARRDLVIAAQPAVKSIEDDLHLAGYEPAAIRPAPAWIERRRRAVAAIARMEGPLLLDLGEGPFMPAIAERLDELAETIRAKTADAARAPHSDTDRPVPPIPHSPGGELQEQVRVGMVELEHALAH